MNIVQTIEKERMTRKVPDFKPGDTVVVQVKVVEGDRERVQAYEGAVVSISNRGRNSSFRSMSARSRRRLASHPARPTPSSRAAATPMA